MNINSLDEIPISDSELAELLNTVYVEGGYTSAELAKKVFTPSLVKARGTLFTARTRAEAVLVGIVIVVPPSSSYKVLAKENECEMH